MSETAKDWAEASPPSLKDWVEEAALQDPDGTAEHDDLLDRLFPARVTIACIVAALVIAIGCGLYAWLS